MLVVDGEVRSVLRGYVTDRQLDTGCPIRPVELQVDAPEATEPDEYPRIALSVVEFKAGSVVSSYELALALAVLALQDESFSFNHFRHWKPPFLAPRPESSEP